MVVLHVLAPAPFGGLESVVRALALGHRRLGHEPHVATVVDPGTPEGPLERSLREAGVPVHALQVSGRAYLRERGLVAALCREIGARVVHTHGYRPDVIAAGAARRLGLPTVTTVHGFTGGGWKNRLYERVQRRAFRRFDAVLAVSRPLLDSLARSGVPSERLHLVPNAWCDSVAPLTRAAARSELGIDPDEQVVGWVGRLSHEKGPDVLVDALARMSSLPFSASVVGDGPERPRLERATRAAGLAERVRWHGAVPAAARLLPAFDVLVLSSRTEGTPMILLEAMAAGVPVVCTAVGGIPQVVSTSEAWLAPPENPAVLAAAIRSALIDRGGAQQRAHRARERLRAEFDAHPWLLRHLDLYQGLAPSPLAPVPVCSPGS